MSECPVKHDTSLGNDLEFSFLYQINVLLCTHTTIYTVWAHRHTDISTKPNPSSFAWYYPHSHEADATWFAVQWYKPYSALQITLETCFGKNSTFQLCNLKYHLLCMPFPNSHLIYFRRNYNGTKGGETVKSCLAEMYFRKRWIVQEERHVTGSCCLPLTRLQAHQKTWRT